MKYSRVNRRVCVPLEVIYLFAELNPYQTDALPLQLSAAYTIYLLKLIR